MSSFKKLRQHTAIIDGAIRVVDFNKIINRDIDNTTKDYCDEIIERLREIGKI